MPSEPRFIALSQRVVEVAGYGERRDVVDQQWSVWLHSLGLVPIPVPNRLAALPAFLERIRPDGVILSGGNNLSGDAYEGAGTGSVDDLAPERDATEAALVKFAIERQLPLLGCCRGLQFLQVYFGGKLSRVPETVKHVASTHPVRWTEKWAQRLSGTEAIEVNSFHNYGIAGGSLAGELLGLAVAADQTVEAFVHRRHPIAGIMWHPERRNPAAESDRRLATALFLQPSVSKSFTPESLVS
jgi:putative glutamine amidotransferase